MGICGKRGENGFGAKADNMGCGWQYLIWTARWRAVGGGDLPAGFQALRQLEERGVRIAVCSGKPTYYLCGFLRQVELRDPILIGENGAVIQMGVELPPRNFYILPYPQQTGGVLRFCARSCKRCCPTCGTSPIWWG